MFKNIYEPRYIKIGNLDKEACIKVAGCMYLRLVVDMVTLTGPVRYGIVSVDPLRSNYFDSRPLQNTRLL